MEGTRTVQTAFRFSPELVRRLKRRARLERKSVNAYVEEAVQKALDSGEDKYARLEAELSGTPFNLFVIGFFSILKRHLEVLFNAHSDSITIRDIKKNIASKPISSLFVINECVLVIFSIVSLVCQCQQAFFVELFCIFGCLGHFLSFC